GGGGRRDGAVGGRPRPVGDHRRNLRASGVRHRQVCLDAGRGAGTGRSVRGGQRGGKDLRDDRLAGGLDDRAGRRDQGGREPPVARHLQRLQRRAGGRARGGQPGLVGGRGEVRGL